MCRIETSEGPEGPKREPLLFTEHLILRAITVEDALEVYGSPDGASSCLCPGGCCAPLEKLREQLTRLVENRRHHGFGLWSACEKRTGKLVGVCGLLFLEGHGPEVELVYRFRLPPWCKHYAREAIAACLNFGFEELDLGRIFAVVDPDRPVSARMIGTLEKSGMSYSQTKCLYGQEAFLYMAERRRSTPVPQQ